MWVFAICSILFCALCVLLFVPSYLVAEQTLFVIFINGGTEAQRGWTVSLGLSAISSRARLSALQFLGLFPRGRNAGDPAVWREESSASLGWMMQANQANSCVFIPTETFLDNLDACLELLPAPLVRRIYLLCYRAFCFLSHVFTDSLR